MHRYYTYTYLPALIFQEATEADFGRYLFRGAALRLESIGRGYSRRLVFEPDSSCSLNENENFFWTDSHPGGVALELQVVDVGDSFHVISPAGVLLGQCDVIKVLVSDEGYISKY